MERRIRRDHPNHELRHARVRVARETWFCYMDGCTNTIPKKEVYARISETRLPVCSAHFTFDDIVEVGK